MAPLARRGGAEPQPFADRAAAGRALAGALHAYAGRSDVVVLGLPRGGVPVAFEVARALDAPLDVVLARKLGVPGHEELALGAIASGGVRALNAEVVRALNIAPDTIEAVAAREAEELARRERAYRDDRPPPEVAGRTAILVDDGLATGATMRAAVAALRRDGAVAIVVAVPVAAPDTCAAFRAEVDDVVCVVTPEPFDAVGLWYENYAPTADAEIRDLLARAWQGDADADAGRH